MILPWNYREVIHALFNLSTINAFFINFVHRKRKECNSKIRLVFSKVCYLLLSLLHLNISLVGAANSSDVERKHFCKITSVEGRFAQDSQGFYQL